MLSKFLLSGTPAAGANRAYSRFYFLYRRPSAAEKNKAEGFLNSIRVYLRLSAAYLKQRADDAAVDALRRAVDCGGALRAQKRDLRCNLLRRRPALEQ
jgi:hypothetical protein